MADPEQDADKRVAVQTAIDAWNRVSADTVGMVYAVRHALAAYEPLVATRVRAQVAEEIAEAIQAPGDRAIYAWEAATIAREHARPAAGTDQPREQP